MNLTLQGEFVDLRPLTVNDAAMTFDWRQSQRSVNMNRGAQSVEQQAVWLARRPVSEYNFAIVLKTGFAVGMVAVTVIHLVHRHAEPGRVLLGD